MLNLKRTINFLKSSDTASAHCDIPCGIYDPHDAIEAAQTCIRMTELILEKQSGNDVNSISRYITAKENHAKKAKDDLLIIWTDYFKPEHITKYPDLHEKVWSACKLGSAVKQTVDIKAAQEFKAAIEEIGKIFWETKK
jgi:nickel superoxide dismutase|tara:strand:+ start:177 stop:593 length:417 start_codon:yes stop_codon:yes gene_type:complete